jgi:hypothetical protein
MRIRDGSGAAQRAISGMNPAGEPRGEEYRDEEDHEEQDEEDTPA